MDPRFALIAVVPATGTRGEGSPYPELAPSASGLEKTSFALLDHLRSVDTQRIRRGFGRVTKEEVSAVDQGLELFLGLAPEPQPDRRRKTRPGRATKALRPQSSCGRPPAPGSIRSANRGRDLRVRCSWARWRVRRHGTLARVDGPSPELRSIHLGTCPAPFPPQEGLRWSARRRS